MHFKHENKTRAQRTPSEWLHVGSQIGTLVNDLADRSDLAVYLGPGAGGPAPACYSPILSEIEVNVDVAFGLVDPEKMPDLNTRRAQYEFPKATGAITHEALHARFSTWDLQAAMKDLDAETFEALNLLEESRIEAIGARVLPENRAFLRICALEIVLADSEANLAEMSKVRQAAHLAALTLARVDAKILKADDVLAIEDAIRVIINDDTLAKLRSIWTRFQGYTGHTADPHLYDLAREWVEAVKEAVDEAGEEPGGEGEGEGSGSGEGGEGEGEGEGSGSGSFSDFLKALAEDAAATEIEAFEELSRQDTSEQWKETASAKQKGAREAAEHKKEAEKCFGAGTGPGSGAGSRSRLVETRKPTGPERAAAVKVSQALERAKYRERDITEIHSVLPPGRLRTRQMVQKAALKANNVQTEVEPWRRTKRTHTDDPTLTVGVLVDISGSMGHAMAPMATTAWVMSEAVRRVQGKAAMVYYGNSVFPTLKPGQHMADVHVYTAPDGTEEFDTAFKALDGSLNLLNGSGARLLVIVSDGIYTSEQTEKARKWVKRCSEAGVAILWLPFDRHYGGSGVAGIVRKTKGVEVLDVWKPAEAATAIGNAAAAALGKVGRAA